jgi:hypothetical protein
MKGAGSVETKLAGKVSAGQPAGRRRYSQLFCATISIAVTVA